MRRTNYFIYTIIFILLIVNGFQKTIFSQESSIKLKFDKVNLEPWKISLEDNCTDSWQKNWVMDGERSRITHSPQGMDYYAGEEAYNDTCHTVLWTNKIFRGDIKIEYDYTRLDTSTLGVNIIYVLATGSGKGAFKNNIFEWKDLRSVPAMKEYYNHMNTYHISYAAFSFNNEEPEYIRARRYMPETGQGLEGTALTPDYENDGLFITGVKHHITVIKRGEDLYMKVSNSTQTKYFWFDTSNFPSIKSGRVGFRQMWTRASRYANINIYEI